MHLKMIISSYEPMKIKEIQLSHTNIILMVFFFSSEENSWRVVRWGNG